MSKVGFALSVTILEWFEFSVYNSIAAYMPKIISNDNSGIGWLIFWASFLARPFGSIYFSRIKSKNMSLTMSLATMCAGTMLIALAPTFIPGIMSTWFLGCKVIQAFALGGSYGMNYLAVYEDEESKSSPLTGTKVAIVQTGFVIGAVLGEAVVGLTKICLRGTDGGVSQNFLTWGWRLPFLVSAAAGMIMLARCRRIDLGNKSESNNNFITYVASHKIKAFVIFVAISIEMVIFYFWEAYYPTVREQTKGLIYSTIYSFCQKGLLIFLFPAAGFMLDNFRRVKSRYNLCLIITGLGFILANLFIEPNSILFLITSAVVTSLCYAALIPWAIEQFKPHNRHIVIGPIFNFAGSIVGGAIPILAHKAGGSLMTLSILMMLPPLLALITRFIQFRCNFLTKQ